MSQIGLECPQCKSLNSELLNESQYRCNDCETYFISKDPIYQIRGIFNQVTTSGQAFSLGVVSTKGKTVPLSGTWEIHWTYQDMQKLLDDIRLGMLSDRNLLTSHIIDRSIWNGLEDFSQFPK